MKTNSFLAAALICLFAGAAVNLGAQTDGDAWIYYAEGADFTITLNDQRSVYPAGAAAENGIRLQRAGMVNTGAGTFLEIQLIPSGTVIKLSENTSMIYNGIDPVGGNADLGLLYGRIRVVTGTSSAVPVVVHSGGVSARVESGDFGVDYFLDPDHMNFVLRPLFRIITFRNTAEIFPYGKGGNIAYFGSYSSLAAQEGWSLLVDISSSFTFAERKPLDEGLRDYWRRRNFAGVPPLAGPDTAIALPAAPAEDTPPPPPPEPVQVIVYVPQPLPDLVPAPIPEEPAAPPILPEPEREFRPARSTGKNVLLTLGMILTAASAGFQAYSYFQQDIYADPFQLYYKASYGTMGLGLILTLAGTLYNPKPE